MEINTFILSHTYLLNFAIQLTKYNAEEIKKIFHIFPSLSIIQKYSPLIFESSFSKGQKDIDPV